MIDFAIAIDKLYRIKAELARNAMKLVLKIRFNDAQENVLRFPLSLYYFSNYCKQ